ncbi:hypothetical protein Pcinc_043619 [Petrolisthes cinctipes]|uniref:Uncharacterized protein n=1 Tax=Petrolisthes cinctipes TaxID=88211 RepID=A0AAE1BIE8_PETCI|nr:hypothetical protein Pcinc_043619 [Petrolisthes cinctipes]
MKDVRMRGCEEKGCEDEGCEDVSVRMRGCEDEGCFIELMMIMIRVLAGDTKEEVYKGILRRWVKEGLGFKKLEKKSSDNREKRSIKSVTPGRTVKREVAGGGGGWGPTHTIITLVIPLTDARRCTNTTLNLTPSSRLLSDVMARLNTQKRMSRRNYNCEKSEQKVVVCVYRANSECDIGGESGGGEDGGAVGGAACLQRSEKPPSQQMNMFINSHQGRHNNARLNIT